MCSHLEEVVNAKDQFVVRSDKRILGILHKSNEVANLYIWELFAEFVWHCNRSVMSAPPFQHVTNKCHATTIFVAVLLV